MSGRHRLIHVNLLGLPLLMFCTLAIADDSKPVVALDLPEVFTADFQEGERPAGWVFTDPEAWRIRVEPRGAVLEQFAQSQYEPKVRSPLNIAWIEGLDLTDFVLDVRLRSTAREYGHRDVCLFFGKQSPSQFYYVHLAREADPHAHSIFLVNEEPRVSIASQRTEGVTWGDDWHHVRIVRDASTGKIEVYFDNMNTPIMSGEDRTFTHGGIGFGTFDDTAQFDEIRIWGRQSSER